MSERNPRGGQGRAGIEASATQLNEIPSGPSRVSKLTKDQVRPNVVAFFESMERQRTEIRPLSTPARTISWDEHRRRLKKAREQRIKVYQGGAPGLGKRA